MSDNQKIYEIAVSHQIGLQRYGAGVVKDVIAHLNDVERDILARLALTADNSKKDLDAFLIYLRTRLDLYKAVINTEMTKAQKELAIYEGAHQAQKLSAVSGATFNKPTDAQLVAAVAAKPIQGRFIAEWAADLSEGTRKGVSDAVRIGFTEGQGTQAIIRRIRGTRANGYKDGVMQISRRNAETVVRTMVNQTATYAREAVYAENQDMIDGVMWSSVLDARTSDVCMARDGQIYKPNEGPRPPAHMNCRSTTIAIFKGVPVPPRLTYNEWLKKQSFKDQVEILGPTRAALFKTGGLSLDRFVDSAGRTYTLDELRKRDLAAFKKAGITAG